MNPYQVMALIAVGTLTFASVVLLLTVSGVPVMAAFLGVYLTALFSMRAMQSRARANHNAQYDDVDHYREPDRRRLAAAPMRR